MNYFKKKKYRVIGVSTGAFFRKDSRIHDNLSRAIKSNPDVTAIEVGLVKVDDLRSFDWENKEHLDFIKSFSSIGIHAPTDLRRFEREEQKKIIDELYEVYKKMGAKYIVFHPYQDFDISIIKGKDWQILVENLLPDKNVTISDMKKIIEENPEFNIMFDTCHALMHSHEYFKEFLETFKDKIKAVHLSTHEGEFGHTPLCRSQGKTLEKMEIIKDLDCPWIIETWGSKYPDEVEKEIHFVKTFSRSI